MSIKMTKPDIILKLINRKSGAALTQLESATGWQPHSVRAALTGLRKKGHEITRQRNNKGMTIYSITGGA